MMSQRPQISRRSLLKALGPFVACLPVANLLRNSIAYASAPVAPLRLILIQGGFHAVEATWHPQTSSGALASSGSSFTLNFPGSSLASLAKYQSKLIVLRGINYQDYKGISFGHQTETTCFTGAKCTYPASEGAGNVTTMGTSIEQYLYQRMAPAGSLPPMTISLLGDSSQQNPLSYFGGIAQRATLNPSVIFQTYFGNFMSQTSMGPSPKLLRRNAMMKYSQDSLNGLLGRLAGPEASKLNEHLSSLTALQSQLNSTLSGGPSCQPPAQSSITVDPGGMGLGQNNTTLTVDTANFITLITQAFACDITRFAVFRLSLPGGNESTYWPQIPGGTSLGIDWTTNGYHPLNHGSNGGTNTINDQIVGIYEAYQMSQIANLMDALAAVSDPINPAQTLLDNTVILFLGEHNVQVHIDTDPTSPYYQYGIDPHAWFDIRALVLGGCGGMFNMGRILETTPRLTTMPVPAGGAYAGVPHNALLTAIINAFEENQQKVNPSFVPKVLSNYGDYPATPLSL